MHVFVTGGAGFIGRVVVPELLSHGHSVLALARSDRTAKLLTELGAEVHRGDLEDLASLRSGAAAADGIIHLAFVHDFDDPNNFPKACAIDRAAIEAMAEVVAGTNKPLIMTSGTLSLGSGGHATEDTEPDRSHPLADRIKSEDLLMKLAKENSVRGMSIRLTPTVYGAGDWAFIPMVIKAARQNGVVFYPGEADGRWPTVHRSDAAVLYRLALEKGRPGAKYNAIAEEGVSIKDIVTLIADKLQLEAKSTSPEEVMQKVGFVGTLLAINNATSGQRTKEELGWQPTRPGLLADMAANYF